MIPPQLEFPALTRFGARQAFVEEAVAQCNRPEAGQRKPAEKLQKELSAIDKALRERQKRQGATVQEVLAEAVKQKGSHTSVAEPAMPADP